MHGRVLTQWTSVKTTKLSSLLDDNYVDKDRSLDIKYACHYATEVYVSILETSHVHEEQLTMFNLAITIFKKKIQQSAQEQQPSTNNH